MGDDLKQARNFIDATMAEMDILLSDARMEREPSEAALTRVQSGAKLMQARGIYRAAQTVLDAYDRAMGQAQIDGRLMALYKLVIQYAEGLDEIAPAAVNEDGMNDIEIIDNSAQDRFDAARDILIPLLPLAGETSPALKFLAGLSAELPQTGTPPFVSFESLMPDVTNTALRTARTEGKSVSVSYAADDLSLRSSQVEEVRSQLEQIVERLVKTHIESPEHRTAKGLSRGGHIDITAKDGREGLDISVICDGETVSLFPKAEAPQALPFSDAPIELGDDVLAEISA